MNENFLNISLSWYLYWHVITDTMSSLILSLVTGQASTECFINIYVLPNQVDICSHIFFFLLLPDIVNVYNKLQEKNRSKCVSLPLGLWAPRPRPGQPRSALPSSLILIALVFVAQIVWRRLFFDP